ncbi:MAG: 30S ribosomal protein S8 [Spiroplasma poulsonii]|uniref:Small ribosomal subunit protein uS8 n=1 Tax=Spiroplasma poulsonii TaxID=2138 RepID=A0A2P6FB99_9MOLU|nr:30S ribosomal protein S8 [Spiroplasma poulsonii]MBH8622401.1 30S ribosomal protein S8 [Spiroplasma sp. hyd1]MBW1241471.1 30S ribosomal protein S8 [Spiroplasma poulsonii]MBW3058148.1 30S ribosomal protein S8 [Spiroplasma poulsonii]PQM30753.1 30S ribosomal protein S8 [Spiroplasma poulsonii]
MMIDTIADMLTRIRNANQRLHKSVIIPSSKMKVRIAEILKEEGYVEDFKISGDVKKELSLTLKYKGKTKVISGLKRISKPGLRVYVTVEKVPQVLNGMGIAIISTSQGIMTDKAAKHAHLGGEVIAYVW